LNAREGFVPHEGSQAIHNPAVIVAFRCEYPDYLDYGFSRPAIPCGKGEHIAKVGFPEIREPRIGQDLRPMLVGAFPVDPKGQERQPEPVEISFGRK
jgi:hypothetical protein